MSDKKVIFETRFIKLKPVDSKTKKAAETKRLVYSICELLPQVANLMVNECLSKYKNVNENEVQYLQMLNEAKRISDVVGKLHIEKIIAMTNGDLAKSKSCEQAIDKILDEKKRKKESAKDRLFKECKKDAFLDTLAADPTFSHIPRIILQRTLFYVTQSFLSGLTEIRTGKRSLLRYNKDHIRIYFRYRNSQAFSKARKNIYFDWIEGMRFIISFGKDKDAVKALLERLIAQNQPYHLYGDAQIFVDKKRRKILLEQPFKIKKESEIRENKLNGKIHMGVDLGFSTPIFWALNDMKTAQFLGDGKKIALQRAKYSARLMHAQKYRNNTKNIRNKERNYFRYLNRKYAAKLVSTAEALDVGVIRMEALSFTELRRKLAVKSIQKNERQAKQDKPKIEKHYYDKLLALHSNWSYSDLTRYIKHYADEKGIEVVFVNPAQTSKICRVCKEVGFREFWDRFSSLHIYTAQKCDVVGCPAHKNLDLTEKRLRKDMREQNKFWCNFISPDENAAFNIATCSEDKMLSWEEGNRRIRNKTNASIE